MDNPSAEPSNSPLDANGAAEAFAALLEPVKQETEESRLADLAAEAAQAQPDAPDDVDVDPDNPDDDPRVTIKIDGKDVEVKLSELKNGYQRQADYTRKTMEVSEQRKAAEAQTQAALQERQAYAQNLQRMQVQIEGALQEQQKIDWTELLNADPVEYLKQQHLFQQRQAAYQQNTAQQQQLAAQFQAEQQRSYQTTLAQQHADLLAKLPDWKDDAKAKADKGAIREYLLQQGYDAQSVDTVADAKAVLLARKAMLYDQLIGKAQTAAKRVSALPQKVERPGNGVQAMDKRSSAFQRLSKSGKVEDAAAVFASFI